MARNREGHPPTVDYTESTRAAEVTPPTDAEAEANVQAVFGDSTAWQRTFDRHTDFDGQAVWIDRDTGEVFKGGMPQLHPSDGRNL